MRIGLAVVAVLLCGCDLYFGGGDDVVCSGGGPKEVPQYQGRNPQTGVCESVGGGWCDDSCGPCPAVDVAQPDWGACYSKCSDLDEQSCFVTSGCFAAYLDDPAADGKRQFWGCWETAPSGPVQGQCSNQDAQNCSRHDDCIAIYSGTTDAQNTNYAGTSFLQCAPEPSTYCIDDSECGANARCDHATCYPSPTCPECPTCGACPDSNTCYGVCVPTDPMACDVIDCGPGYHCEEQCYPGPMSYCEPVCVQDQTCANVDCGPGYTCSEVCTTDSNGMTSCSPVCVPQNPGDCYGPVSCDALPPACPMGTVPGVLDGCWSGYCIPQSQCPLAACGTLTTESACVARMDCMPIYEGTDCTCYPNGCECQVLTYERCEPL